MRVARTQKLDRLRIMGGWVNKCRLPLTKGFLSLGVASLSSMLLLSCASPSGEGSKTAAAQQGSHRVGNSVVSPAPPKRKPQVSAGRADETAAAENSGARSGEAGGNARVASSAPQSEQPTTGGSSSLDGPAILSVIKPPTRLADMREGDGAVSAESPVQTASEKNHAVREVMDRIKFNITDEKIQVQTASNIFQSVIVFLMENFGQPFYNREPIIVNIGHSLESEAQVRISNGRKRDVYLNSVNVVFETERMYIAHELFHALYQSDRWLRTGSQADIEGWATYAQYLYRYPKLSNQEIADTLRKDFPAIERPTVSDGRAEVVPWQVLPPAQRIENYIRSAYALLRSDRYSNYLKYRETILRLMDTPNAAQLSSASSAPSPSFGDNRLQGGKTATQQR